MKRLMFVLALLLISCNKNPVAPRMFGPDETTSGVASASSIIDDALPIKAFDDDENTVWASGNTDFPHWITFDFINTKKIEMIRILCPVSPWDGKAYLNTFLVYAGNDTANLEMIFASASVDSSKSAWQEFEYQNNSAFRYYRILFLNSWSTITKIINIAEIEMMQAI